jgi:hypothetical protein
MKTILFLILSVVLLAALIALAMTVLGVPTGSPIPLIVFGSIVIITIVSIAFRAAGTT